MSSTRSLIELFENWKHDVTDNLYLQNIAFCIRPFGTISAQSKSADDHSMNVPLQRLSK